MESKAEKEILEEIRKAESNPLYPIVEGRTFDYVMIFALAKKFAVPFQKMKAYKMGIIDEKGNILRPPKTAKEKDAFTPLDNIIVRIKKLIPKNLWYLLTFAYMFKGFASRKTYASLYESCETEEEMLEAEEKILAMKRAKKEVDSIIKENPNFDEEDFWNFITTFRDI